MQTTGQHSGHHVGSFERTRLTVWYQAQGSPLWRSHVWEWRCNPMFRRLSTPPSSGFVNAGLQFRSRKQFAQKTRREQLRPSGEPCTQYSVPHLQAASCRPVHCTGTNLFDTLDVSKNKKQLATMWVGGASLVLHLYINC